MDKRIEDLTLWGADTQGALNRMMGDEAFYLSMLQEMAASPDMSQLPQLLALGQYAQARMCAHSLKGAAANLGLTPLAQILGDICTYLAAGGQDAAVIVQMCDAYTAQAQAFQHMIQTA